ncbi:MAG: sulfurtransferase [Acidihalobacter sp.]|uniref:sulfurtransferase n=1 Tax=Acidihalobacter sp. TaxID=1872108 RepID=UPI00307E86F3
MKWRTLVSPAELAARIDEPEILVVDCRFDLAHPRIGLQAYAEGHLPRAVYADLEADLSAEPGPLDGRHPLPDPDELARKLGGWGIGDGTQVVAYDDAGGAWAGRLWWLLRWLGHERVAVLDGGVPAWIAEGYALSREEAARSPRSFTPSPDSAMMIDVATLAQELERGACRLVDVRAAARFRGEQEPIDPVAGHVPGAVNRPFAENLDPSGRFLPAVQLAGALQELCAGLAPERVVAMCGSGVTACHLLLAMAHAGLPVGRLYPGSWSEWIRDPRRSVAVGE